MPLNKGKHVIAEIEGTRCTVVETGLTEARAAFLKDLLENNHFEVKTEPENSKEGAPTGTLILGVTDLEFNPVVKVYERKLFRNDGKVVSPAWWNQWEVQDDEIPYIEIIHQS